MDASDLLKTVDYCRSKLPLSSAQEEFRFESIPLAVLKSVSCIGIKTPKLTEIVNLYHDIFISRNISENSHCVNTTGEVSVSNFIKHFENLGFDQKSSDVYKQRGNYLAEEAINAYMFCRTLHSFDVDCSSDLDKIVGNIFFENQIRNLPGQRNGDSLKFFYMYAGIEYPLPDRILRKFINSAIKKSLGIKECKKLIEQVAQIIDLENSENTPGLLEKLIWSYQLAQKKLRIVWQDCDEIRPGHGVFLYDKDRKDLNSYEGDVVAYVEGYSI